MLGFLFIVRVRVAAVAVVGAAVTAVAATCGSSGSSDNSGFGSDSYSGYGSSDFKLPDFGSLDFSGFSNIDIGPTSQDPHLNDVTSIEGHLADISASLAKIAESIPDDEKS